jgi:hypothetical protein
VDGRQPARRAGRAGAEPGSHSAPKPRQRPRRRQQKAGTGHASLVELLAKIKGELEKLKPILGPIIDLEVAREPQGSRTEGGSTVIEHGWRSRA